MVLTSRVVPGYPDDGLLLTGQAVEARLDLQRWDAREGLFYKSGSAASGSAGFRLPADRIEQIACTAAVDGQNANHGLLFPNAQNYQPGLLELVVSTCSWLRFTGLPVLRR